MDTTLLLGNCLEKLAEMPDCSIDAIVTDPPYGLSFMGKKWDYDVPSEDIWKECLRVLKPGGHLLAFAGTRTQHRMAVRIEDAGFEIRDMIAWVYGSGFPKSMDVSKAIDKAAGAEREVVGSRRLTGAARIVGGQGGATSGRADAMYETHATRDTLELTAPATASAREWSGWGTALKPALEPITVARKPLGEKTVAANVLAHGTGAINVDGCRVEAGDLPHACKGTGWAAQDKKNAEQGFRPSAYYEGQGGVDYEPNNKGRWPANLIHDGTDEVVGLFPQQQSGANPTRRSGMGFNGADGQDSCFAPRGTDAGSAARFFYCAKTSKRERGEGNNHPTVKPIALMRHLCRLVTPPGGTVLDPFMGSGSTGIAAGAEGFDFIGIELDPDYFAIAQSRTGGS